MKHSMAEAIRSTHVSPHIELLGALVMMPTRQYTKLNMLAEEQQPRKQLILRDRSPYEILITYWEEMDYLHLGE